MKRKGSALRDFIPGYIAAVQRTPIQTAANLPGGGALFEVCTRATEPAPVQLDFNAAVAAECDAHAADEHYTCPGCGVVSCLFWMDTAREDFRCSCGVAG